MANLLDQHLTDTQRAVVATIQEGASRNLAADGVLTPLAFVLKDAGKLEILALDFSSPEAKRATIAGLRAYLAVRNPQLVALITEAWAIQRPATARIDERPSTAADRIEIVSLTVETRHASLGGSAPMLRQGTAVTLGDWAWAESCDGANVSNLMGIERAGRN